MPAAKKRSATRHSRRHRRSGRKTRRRLHGGENANNMYKGLRVLVTGGAGFIGSNLVDALLAAGADHVRVLDNLITGKPSNLEKARAYGEKFEFMLGDITDLDMCRAACRDVNVVFHEAALVSVPISMEKPVFNNETNITGTLNMMLAARDAGVGRFVYASSAAVYGNDPESDIMNAAGQVIPRREDMPRKYPSPYALSKAVDEDYAHLFANHMMRNVKVAPEKFSDFDMTCVGLRYFNVYGPRQDPTSAYSGVISIFVDRFLTNQAKATIFGDGEQTRDFVFVMDVVKGNMLAGLHTFEEGTRSKVYNVGTGRSVTLNQLVETIKTVTGNTTTEVVRAEGRPGNIRHSKSNIGRISANFGYAPAFGLEEGLDILVASIKAEKAKGNAVAPPKSMEAELVASSPIPNGVTA